MSLCGSGGQLLSLDSDVVDSPHMCVEAYTLPWVLGGFHVYKNVPSFCTRGFVRSGRQNMPVAHGTQASQTPCYSGVVFAPQRQAAFVFTALCEQNMESNAGIAAGGDFAQFTSAGGAPDGQQPQLHPLAPQRRVP